MNEPTGGQAKYLSAMVMVINTAPVKMPAEGNGGHGWHWLNGAADLADYQAARGDGG